jgi:CRISPR/Cas system-associated exonuclease Cas4 (RecB family)
MTLTTRPDLRNRTGLSKSALNTFDLCPTQAWFELHARRPLIPSERITFGSALDAAIEQVVSSLRAGTPVIETVALAAAAEVMERDQVEISLDEIERAVGRFMVEIAPKEDWSFCRLQPAIHEEVDGLGEVDGHPDIVLASGDVIDVKSAKKAKPEAPTIENGIYALLVEAETGKAVARTGYAVWVRIARPYWQRLVFPVTDELRRWTRERAAGYLRAKKADEVLNRKTPNPRNFTMASGPKFPSLCETCAYAPANGGPCQIAWNGGSTDEIA